MARRPYSTACRFFKDSSQTIMIRWYPAAEPIEVLPFPSKINSLDWSSFPEIASGVGEVYGESRNYNGRQALPYAHGLTPCEPAEVFAQGEDFDPARPPMQRDENGFPLCCLNRFAATGGLLWGGSAVVNVVPGAIAGGPTCSVSVLIPTIGTVKLQQVGGTRGWWYFDSSAPSVTIHFVSAVPNTLLDLLVGIGDAAGLPPGDGCVPTLWGDIGPGITFGIPNGFGIMRVSLSTLVSDPTAVYTLNLS